ncbi:MAG: hypothetical protein EXS14_06960 [Planctomycetes bacterium]|nr:hypothetical protein [Planctomycetota bacterium]
MIRYTTLLCAFAFLVACTNTPERTPVDQTTTAPDFAAAAVVDIAVVRPVCPEGSDELLGPDLRAATRKALINEKQYAVPVDSFVDGVIAQTNLEPTRGAEAMGSDGVLSIRLEQWEAGAFIGSGRVVAGAKATLYGKGGKVLWEHTLKDRTVLYGGAVNGSNFREAIVAVTRTFASEVLATLPRKLAR